MGTWRTDRGFACELQKQSSRSKPEMVYIGFGTKGLDELGFVPSDGGCAAVLAGDGERPHLGGEPGDGPERGESGRSEEHPYELQSLMSHSYAVLCLQKNTHNKDRNTKQKKN